jgi:hypothetical protein
LKPRFCKQDHAELGLQIWGEPSDHQSQPFVTVPTSQDDLEEGHCYRWFVPATCFAAMSFAKN